MRDRGLVDTVTYAVQRALQALSPGAMFERLHVVSQPVPPAASAALMRTGSIDVRELSPGDAALQTFERRPDEIVDRFNQGAVCLGAFRRQELIGWLWFARDGFRDGTYPLCIVLEPKCLFSWDFDVYVRSDARLSTVFARLWAAAFEYYRRSGIVESLSFISGNNPASLRAHRRLGVRELGTVLVARIGMVTLVLSRQFSPRFQLSLNHEFVATLVIRLHQVPAKRRS